MLELALALSASESLQHQPEAGVGTLFSLIGWGLIRMVTNHFELCGIDFEVYHFKSDF